VRSKWRWVCCCVYFFKYKANFFVTFVCNRVNIFLRCCSFCCCLHSTWDIIYFLSTLELQLGCSIVPNVFPILILMLLYSNPIPLVYTTTLFFCSKEDFFFIVFTLFFLFELNCEKRMQLPFFSFHAIMIPM